jgi:restriction endonuclease S subunit
LPDYLTLALNSILVKMQAERDAGGSVILHWRTNEISNVVVPLVAMATQQEIAELLKQSFELKAKSERVLDVARRVVEIAIEKDENSALAFLKAQV